MPSAATSAAQEHRWRFGGQSIRTRSKPPRTSSTRIADARIWAAAHSAGRACSGVRWRDPGTIETPAQAGRPDQRLGDRDRRRGRSAATLAPASIVARRLRAPEPLGEARLGVVVDQQDAPARPGQRAGQVVGRCSSSRPRPSGSAGSRRGPFDGPPGRWNTAFHRGRYRRGTRCSTSRPRPRGDGGPAHRNTVFHRPAPRPAGQGGMSGPSCRARERPADAAAAKCAAAKDPGRPR